MASNFQLFRNNDDLITFLTILRLCDEDGNVDTTMSNFKALSRLEDANIRNSMNDLANQGLVSGNIDSTIFICKVNVDKKKWWGGDAPRPIKQEPLSPIELQFKERLKCKFDRIANMARPLLLKEYNKLKERYTDEQILKTMLAMQNCSYLNKYVSAYDTLRVWLERAYGER